MAFAFFCLAFVMVLLTLRVFGGWRSTGTLVEYQRGVIFRRGIPLRDIGPGRYRVWVGIEKVMTVDARPVQVNYENQNVMLNDGTAAIYSVSGSARVIDVRKTMYTATNYNHVPAFVMLCCARFVLNECTGAEIVNRSAVTERIVNRAKPKLAARGFELLSFRLTELAVAQLRTGEQLNS